MYESKIKDELVDQLFEAILKLRNLEECYRFFEDIATINEIKALAQRLEVAKMLGQKKTYIEIAEKTGASTATISRVNRALNYGANGYKIILDRLETESRD
ncbi:YerC/YecD family TrpR-related protein [Thermoanaerobacter wiegelii]|uniref:TrpR like protein, YerC/YecD n=1 Tax=Thermoanaerobacter wiegelii Rt8.B1 TaxID=697303 RepID=G2MSS7_9THEO|nr:YerC/YecD family TrpR-related protein [Thermoanaerobacter wiegelii]AEM78142.1 TrpR like protein, YerC/YecD [Thermoanaerobacter wiegelii Rt8.B1]